MGRSNTLSTRGDTVIDGTHCRPRHNGRHPISLNYIIHNAAEHLATETKKKKSVLNNSLALSEAGRVKTG